MKKSLLDGQIEECEKQFTEQENALKDLKAKTLAEINRRGRESGADKVYREDLLVNL